MTRSAAHRKAIGEAMTRVHARKRQLITTYQAALVKIERLASSGKRARNIAAKALNGHPQ